MEEWSRNQEEEKPSSAVDDDDDGKGGLLEEAMISIWLERRNQGVPSWRDC